MSVDDHQPYQQGVQNQYRAPDQPNVASDVIPTSELLPISSPIQMPSVRHEMNKRIIFG
jgi:hypothetical protein